MIFHFNFKYDTILKDCLYMHGLHLQLNVVAGKCEIIIRGKVFTFLPHYSYYNSPAERNVVYFCKNVISQTQRLSKKMPG